MSELAHAQGARDFDFVLLMIKMGTPASFYWLGGSANPSEVLPADPLQNRHVHAPTV